MPYGRRGVRRSALKNYTATGNKRRRISIATRAKLKKPTAYNQRRQIVSLAKRVAKNIKYIRSKKVYTDYQWGDSGSGTRGITQLMTNGIWYGWALTDYSRWIACLRSDQNAVESSRTYTMRMQLNFRIDVGTVTKGAFLNIFLVTPRTSQTNPITFATPAVDGAIAPLVLNNDFIENSQNQGTNVRLNSGKFKVHACKYVTLVSDTFDDAPPTTQTIGNPYSTWRKFQWNVPLKFSIMNPTNRPWRLLPFDQQAFWRKYYLVVYATNNDGGDTNSVKFSCDPMMTCINFD